MYLGVHLGNEVCGMCEFYCVVYNNVLLYPGIHGERFSIPRCRC